MYRHTDMIIALKITEILAEVIKTKGVLIKFGLFLETRQSRPNKA